MYLYYWLKSRVWRVFAPLIRFSGREFYAPFMVNDKLKIDLITSQHFDRLPEGTVLITIDGLRVTKGVDAVRSDFLSWYISVGFPSIAKRMPTFIGKYREQ